MVDSKNRKRYSISNDGSILVTCHPAQGKAAAAQVVDLNRNWEKKFLCPTIGSTYTCTLAAS